MQQGVPQAVPVGQVVLAERPPLALQPALRLGLFVFDRCYVEVAGLIPHGDLLLKGHLPALRVPVGRGQQAIVTALGRIAVQLAFIMPKGDDILLQVGLGAALQLMPPLRPPET